MHQENTHLFPFSNNPSLEELNVWLNLTRIPQFGKAKLAVLADYCGNSFERLATLKTNEVLSLGFKENQALLLSSLHRAQNGGVFSWLNKCNENYLLPLNHRAYPEGLRQVSSPPLVLFVKGDSKALVTPQVSLVGSRNPSEAGKHNAFEFARQLSALGFTITSGLAIGVDSFAHKGALANKGKTIAVLGSGVERIYPRRNSALVDNILENGGCLVSEFFPDTEPKAQHFPRRNRLISGLSWGTLVVEAAVKSGSLITAYSALQQNREVFAIPGNIRNPLASGCHHLIKQGAKLTEQVADIVEEFPEAKNDLLQNAEKKLQKSTKQCLATDLLLDSVDFDTTSVDQVAQRSGLPTSVVLTKLLEYELRGLVASVAGGYVKLGE